MAPATVAVAVASKHIFSATRRKRESEHARLCKGGGRGGREIQRKQERDREPGKNERSTLEREQTSSLGKKASERASEQAREREGEQ